MGVVAEMTLTITSKRAILLLLLIALVVAPVLAAPPKIVMNIERTEGIVPFTVRFSEDSGDATTVSWLWEFGNEDAFDKQRGEYTYDRAGEYTLQLTVSNDKGESSVDATRIVVTGAVETQTPTPTPTPTATPTPKPTISDTTTFVTVWQGTTPIKDSLSTKSSAEAASVLKEATDTVMKKETYPYDVASPAESKTTFKILKFRCDEKMQICGYWVYATRDGKEVATNSPIWISPPPFVALVSETYDEKSDTITTTLKEDPKLAIEQILQQYVDNQPIGKPIIGTKE